MKKLYILFLCAILCTATLNAQTWNCGDPNINGGADVTATLSGSTLTISGTGDMADYAEAEDQPWASHQSFITKVVIGDNVNNIGYQAFQNCSSLIEVTIGNSVTIIDRGAFRACSSLDEVVFGNSVTTIGGWAFEGCSSLTEVTVGNSITIIGDYAFAGCSSLDEVTIGNSVILIYDYAFADCGSLQEVTIGNSVTIIGEAAFRRCYGLKTVTIPNSVTEIGGLAFCDCSSLTDIFIPNSVTTIGGSAFDECFSLTAINVDAGNNDYSSVDGVLFNKDQTTLMKCPCTKQGGYAIPNIVTTIDGAAFRFCSDLSAVNIPNSVNYIGNGAFDGCSKLTEVAIPDLVTGIFDFTFTNCSSLIKVTFGNSFTYIGASAFSGCISLEEVIFPNSLEHIRGGAFIGCVSLKEVTIPSSVTTIERAPFEGCSNLTNINVEAGNNDYSSVDGVLFNKDQTILVEYPGGKQGGYIIPGSVITIGGSSFARCDNLSDVFIGNSVTTIGSGAFYYCLGLTEFTIPRTVTTIEWYAFENCYNLTEVTNHTSSPQPIETQAFQYTNISQITLRVPAGAISAYQNDEVWSLFNPIEPIDYGATCATTIDYGSVTKNITWMLCEDGTLTINGTGAMPDYDLEGSPWYAYHEDIKTVIISDGVTNIGQLAFAGCSSLEEIHFPNSLEHIRGGAFEGCSSLKEVTIPNSVTTIEHVPFAGCSSLTEINVDAGNNDYSSVDGVLFNKDQTTLVEYPGGKQGGYTIPGSVATIGEFSFWGCSNLSEVTIPNSVKTIEYGAFAGCIDLTEITNHASAPHGIDWNVFAHIDFSQITLRVPAESVGDYLAANVWQDFIIEAIDYGATCATIIDYGSVTPKITWILCEDGTLTINGTGEMPDYADAEAQPWASHRSSIEKAVIGYGVATIGSNAFFGCEDLSSVAISNSVTYIGSQAFYGCSRLISVTIPNSVTTIGNAAFRFCTGLTYLFIPSSVTFINGIIFENCSSLEVIEVDVANADYSSLDGVLFNKDQTKLINYPGGKGDYSIPETVQTIGGGSFANCKELTSIIIPNSVEIIEENVFWSCTNLKTVYIGSSVVSIDWSVFNDCHGLRDVTVNWLDPSIVDTNPQAFGLYNPVNVSMVNLHIPACTYDLYIAEPVWKDFNIVQSWEIGASNPADVIATLDNSTLTISGEGAMQNFEPASAPWHCAKERMTTIVIQSGVTTIGDHAFAGCINLEEITNHASSPQPIDAGVFTGVDISQITLRVPDESVEDYLAVEVWKDFKKPFVEIDYCAICEKIIASGDVTETMTWTLCDDGVLKICGTGEIPDYNSIPEQPWYSSNNRIETLMLSEGITRIGDDAFSYCSELTSVNIPHSVSSIGGHAFSYCSGLPSVDIPNSVSSIGFAAFYNCSSLTSVAIPHSVTSIEEYAFNNCIALMSINVDANNLIYTHENGVLFNKEKTTLIMYPGGKTGAYTIPNSVTSIGNSAFWGCSGLIEVTIPNSIITIGGGAFAGCSNLTEVTNYGSVPQPIFAYVFQDVDISQITLRVSNCFADAYLAADVWKDFNIEAIDYGATVADFEEVLPVCSGSEIQFVNTSVKGHTYEWDFGDGATSFDENPTHIYTVDGVDVFDDVYDVTLTVTCDNTDEKDIITRKVVVQAIPEIPIARQYAYCEDSFNPSYNIDVTPSATTVSIKWFDQSNGDIPIGYGASVWVSQIGASPVATPESPGTPATYQPFIYYAQAIGGNNCESGRIEVPLTIYQLPNASFTLDLVSACPPAHVTFSNTSNTTGAAPNNAGTKYLWNFGDGTDEGSAGTETVSHMYYNLSGTELHIYPALTAVNEWADISGTSGSCESMFTQAIVIYPLVQAEFEMEPDGDTPCSPLTVNFRNVSVGHEDFMYDFGDGDTFSGDKLSGSLTSHTFQTLNMYEDMIFSVSLTASSEYGCTDVYAQEVLVRSSPVAAFTLESPYPEPYVHPCIVEINNLITESDMLHLSYRWTWTDEKNNENHLFSEAAAPSPIYIPMGDFSITQYVFAPNGICVSSLTLLSSVVPPDGAPVITTNDLPDGKVGEAYSVTLAADSELPVTWSFTDNDALPEGLTLAGATGVISGVPAQVGIFDVTVMAVNDYGTGYNKDMSICIARGAGATLERPVLQSATPGSITVKTLLAPSTGQTVEYAIRAGLDEPSPVSGWQSGTTFSGLNADALYFVFARSAENADYLAGAASVSLPLMTWFITGMGEIPQASPLKAWVQNGLLRVEGLTEGAVWSVYGVHGALVYRSVAAGSEAVVRLPAPAGVYIVQSGERTIKVMIHD